MSSPILMRGNKNNNSSKYGDLTSNVFMNLFSIYTLNSQGIIMNNKWQI